MLGLFFRVLLRRATCFAAAPPGRFPVPVKLRHLPFKASQHVQQAPDVRRIARLKCRSWTPAPVGRRIRDPEGECLTNRFLVGKTALGALALELPMQIGREPNGGFDRVLRTHTTRSTKVSMFLSPHEPTPAVALRRRNSAFPSLQSWLGALVPRAEQSRPDLGRFLCSCIRFLLVNQASCSDFRTNLAPGWVGRSPTEWGAAHVVRGAGPGLELEAPTAGRRLGAFLPFCRFPVKFLAPFPAICCNGEKL